MVFINNALIIFNDTKPKDLNHWKLLGTQHLNGKSSDKIGVHTIMFSSTVSRCLPITIAKEKRIEPNYPLFDNFWNICDKSRVYSLQFMYPN